jgi:hypothetical protein
MQDSLFVFNFGYNYFEIEFQNIHCGTSKKIAIKKWRMHMFNKLMYRYIDLLSNFFKKNSFT